MDTIEDIEEKGWTGFHSDEKGLFLYDYVVKGFLKSAGLNLAEQTKIKQSRSKIDNLIFIFPRRLHILTNGKFIKSVDGVVERPLRAQTMQGPRVTLARSDYVEAGAALDFEAHVIGNEKGMKIELIEELLEFGKYMGLGQFRTGSYGRFEWEKVK